MTSNELLQADVLDILFEHRNKSYGAYALRKNYNHRLLIAIAGALSFSVILLLLVQPREHRNTVTAAHKDSVIVNTFKLPPDATLPPEPQPRAAGRPLKTDVFNPPRIVRDPIEHEPMKTNSELTNLRLGAVESDGIPGAPEESSGITPPTNPSLPTAPPTPEPPKLADRREPEFPGGYQGWIRYMQKFLRVPEDLGENDKRNVLVTFTVMPDGTPSNFKITRSGGSEYDAEVLRVMKKMPKWKPAIENGVPVPKEFTQPVTFMGVAQ